MELEENIMPTEVSVVDVQFRPGQKIYYFDPVDKEYQLGDHLIIETARGPEFGICVGGNHLISSKDVVAPLREVVRLATDEDEETLQENRKKEAKAYEICVQKIAEHQLDMQLVSAECAFDGSKLLFFFTADERVDFRDLVKSLASVFHTRIELRQIGVRDKAKMVGGLGICGRPFCCSTFLDDFQPVSIKMAKTQNLSLNPTKISGTCGRLMCCLKYEQDVYEDLIRNSPKAESFVDTPDGRGTITEVELLTEKVKVRMESNPEAINTYANSDIVVLRSGKAKKTDNPVPSDLAPISGSKHPEQKEPKEPVEKNDTLSLEPIRFRYSEESITEDIRDTAETTKPKKQKKNHPEKKSHKDVPAQEGSDSSSVTEKSESTQESNHKNQNKNHFRRYRKNRPQKANTSSEQ